MQLGNVATRPEGYASQFNCSRSAGYTALREPIGKDQSEEFPLRGARIEDSPFDFLLRLPSPIGRQSLPIGIFDSNSPHRRLRRNLWFGIGRHSLPIGGTAALREQFPCYARAGSGSCRYAHYPIVRQSLPIGIFDSNSPYKRLRRNLWFGIGRQSLPIG